jgi:hypothetical protein
VILLTGRSIRPATNQPATSDTSVPRNAKGKSVTTRQCCQRAARTLATWFLVTDVPIAGNLTIF